MKIVKIVMHAIIATTVKVWMIKNIALTISSTHRKSMIKLLLKR